MPTQFAPTNKDLLRRTTRADFFAELGVAQSKSLYNAISMDLDSDSDQEVLAFFGAIPKPHRVDRAGGGGITRERRALKDYAKTIVNATWKSEVPFDRATFEDAKLDQIRVRAQTQADSAISFLDERMTAIIEANGTSYDGVAFFAASHDGGTGDFHDNDITGTAAAPTAPTTSESEVIINNMITRLLLLEDDQNRKANHGNGGEDDLLFMIPPGYFQGFASVLDVGPVAGQTGNSGVFKGRAKLMVNPFISSSLNERVYLFAIGKPLKPVIHQKREEWEFKLIMDGDDWEKRDEGAMISRSRFEFAGGDHKKAVRAVIT